MDDKTSARARALRAARVVTLGLAMSSVPACSESREAGTDSGTSAPVDAGRCAADASDCPGPDSGAPIDAGVAPSDAGHDGGSARSDAGHDGGSVPGTDAGSDGGPIAPDAGLVCPPIFPPNTRECCEAEEGGFWDESSGMCFVAVPGPFVPPSE